ncbi:NB-ARC domain-containing protein [Gloeobacter morelensis]|uniref:Pentapeptide repeat-containing protein n=1 Tax=Gloeobacter morelensis MG652769 TaxID=2781736 RepID=A0ABY3PH14_9CYAN|nr:NB-ARC domain-containing protein [Gloeobacter morelensis]UFP92930.1 pentapeptide repeat-containing protein [Gloeobacter morelensis MG652769]
MGSLRPPSRRNRGVVLSKKGLATLEEARAALEAKNNYGASYTLEQLSELTGLSCPTIAKVLDGEEGVDKRTLERFFRAFNLKLTKSDYQAVGNPGENLGSRVSKTQQDWAEAIDVKNFHGRAEELAALTTWIVQDKCRVVALLGMGGIGKTSLSVKLAETVTENFDYVLWRSLRNAPPLQEILVDIFQFVGLTQPPISHRVSNVKQSQLIDLFRSHRCLIVFDNVETVMDGTRKAGYYREGYEDYGELFKSVGSSSHKSCLVLTSREKPKDLGPLEGKTLPVRSLRLQGLQENDGLEILKERGLDISTGDSKELLRYYGGNPLAIKMVASTIRTLFGNNISNFVAQGTSIFGDVRDLLSQHFNRLSELERQVMYWLSIHCEPIALSELHAVVLLPMTVPELLEAMESLSRRSLVEENKLYFSLQPVITEYILDQLIHHAWTEVQTRKLSLLKQCFLLKAQGPDYIRSAQLRLIVHPLVIRLKSFFKTPEAIEKHFAHIFSDLRKEAFGHQGYAGGNLLNILCAAKVDLRGWDLSGLAVWQADLRNANLQQCNLAQCDLSQSMFIEPLGNISSVKFNPNRNVLATGDADGKVCLWQLPDGIQLNICEGHTAWVWSVGFSPDGSVLASGSSDQTVRLWESATGRCLRTLQGHANSVWSVGFSPDGSVLASGSSDQTVRLWESATGRCLRTLRGHEGWVLSLAFSPDGSVLASGSSDQTVRLWESATGRCLRTLRGHTDWIHSVDFSPDGRSIASAGADRTVRLWDTATGECQKSLLGHSSLIWSVAFSPNGRILASGGQDALIKLWDVATAQCRKILQGHTNLVYSVAFSPDGQTLASGSADQAVRLWRTDTGQCRKTIQGYTSGIYSVAFSPDGGTIAGGSTDHTVRLWDAATGDCRKILAGHNSWVFAVAFSPDGRTLASGSVDHTVRLWDTATGRCRKILEGHSSWVWSAVFSPDGATIATGSADRTVCLWNAATGRRNTVLQAHTGWVSAVAFSADGRVLASASADGTVRLWNVGNGLCVALLAEHSNWVHSVAFSQDGSLLASGSADGTVRLWDLQSGRCARIIEGHASPVWSVAFSLDGALLASAGEDRIIRIWRISTGEIHRTFPGHTRPIWSVAFSPDGRLLASGSQDESIALWETHSAERLRVLRNLKPYEGMNLSAVSGLTEARKATLKALGAIVDISGQIPMED